MYISLWPLCRGCQQECRLMTAVLDICWLGTKPSLQIPFTQPTKHPANGSLFLTLDSIRSIFQWEKLLISSGLLSREKKKEGFYLFYFLFCNLILDITITFAKLTKNRKFMGVYQTKPFCVTAKIFSQDYLLLHHKNITKNKVSLERRHISSIFCETFVFFLDLKFCFENMKILLYQSALEPLWRP